MSVLANWKVSCFFIGAQTIEMKTFCLTASGTGATSKLHISMFFPWFNDFQSLLVRKKETLLKYIYIHTYVGCDTRVDGCEEIPSLHYAVCL